MTRAKYIVANLSLILILNGVIAPWRALAGDEPGKKHTRARFVTATHSRTAAGEAPLGVVESYGSYKVNGQRAYGKEVIWRGDLVQAHNKVGARVSLGEFGKATLEMGTTVRFTTIESSAPGRHDLLIRLIAGSVTVALQTGTRAYLDSFDASFIAGAGARFRFGIRENRTVVDLLGGKVADLGSWVVQAPPPIMLAAARASRAQAQAQAPRQPYRIKPVGGISESAVFDVRARATRQIQVQVTDENDRPVPDIPIIFALGSNIGRFGATTVSTNPQGIATVTLTGGNQAASGPFTATIQGTNISLSGQIVVMRALPMFWTFQNAGPVLATAAAAVAVTSAAVITQEDKLPIRAVGGPVIKP